MTHSDLRRIIKETVRQELEEAQVLDLKKMAREIVDQYFSFQSGMGPSVRTMDDRQLNRFRDEMETQIAAAMKGVIRRHNRGQYVTSDGSAVWK